MGHISDAKNRNNQARKYEDISELVKAAWDAIYKHGAPIGGAYVQRLLKPTSTVRTLVSSKIFPICHGTTIVTDIYLAKLECLYRTTWFRF